jgi:hypothetical protein
MNNCYVNPIGGLGNQLFIIAAGYAYAKKHNKKLIIVPDNWKAGQGNSILSYKDTLFKNFEYGSPPFTRDVITVHERRFNYDELPFVHGSLSLHGYFQSLKYFEEFKDEFISLLELPDVDVEYLRGGSQAVVGFHIRRGDYLIHKNIHYVCDTNFFNYFFDKFKGEPIKVFTDSPNQVLQEFPQEYHIIHSESDIKEFTYMSKCDIIVGSNSTFSWWASLIGGKTSYFPSKWFADGREHGDIYREDMVLHDV